MVEIYFHEPIVMDDSTFSMLRKYFVAGNEDIQYGNNIIYHSIYTGDGGPVNFEEILTVIRGNFTRYEDQGLTRIGGKIHSAYHSLFSNGTMLAEWTIADATMDAPLVFPSETFAPRFLDGDDMIRGSRGDDVLRGYGGANSLLGYDGDDVLHAGDDGNRLSGGRGDDILHGGAGSDQLIGGQGRNILIGGAGGDRFDGQGGDSIASYETAPSRVVVDLAKSTFDFLNKSVNKGHAKGDWVQGVDDLRGSSFSDTLLGNDADNRLEGLPGDDVLNGRKGSDVLVGGGGKDTMTGGGGSDLFVLNTLSNSKPGQAGRDVILDFKIGQDRLDVSAIDAEASSKASNQKFAFIGRAAFSGNEGELRYENTGKKTFVYGDVDGDRTADFAVEFTGKIALTKADFVL